MGSTRTPTAGTIRMSDLDKSIIQGWISDSPNQSLQHYAVDDFNPGTQPNGFAYCYGTPGTASPHRLSYFYNILGWVDYTIVAVNVNNVGFITVDFNPMNGSNGTPPSSMTLDTTLSTLPNGSAQAEGAHWETLQFVVNVGGMTGGSFDVYFEGTYIDTITGNGIYVYDNGGLGYTNGSGSAPEVRFQ